MYVHARDFLFYDFELYGESFADITDKVFVLREKQVCKKKKKKGLAVSWLNAHDIDGRLLIFSDIESCKQKKKFIRGKND